MEARKSAFLSVSYTLLFLLLAACAANTIGSEKREELVRAIVAGDNAKVKKLVNEGALVNPPSTGSGAAPLEVAVSKNDLEIVKLLVEAGADVNSTGRFMELGADWRSNPLHTAVVDGSIEIARYLIQQGAEVDARQDGDTVLWGAIRSVHNRSNKFEIVKLLVENGASVNSVGVKWETTTGCSATPLHEAVFSLDLEVTNYLLKHGANTRMKDVNGRTPLDCARHRLAVIQLPELEPIIEKHIELLLQYE